MVTQVIDFLLTLVVRILLAALRYLPERAAMAIANGLVRTGIFVAPRFRKTADRNLSRVFPDRSPAERREIFDRSLGVLARNLFMFARVKAFRPEDFERMFDYSELRIRLAEIRERAGEKGLLLLCMHYGCFEFMSQAHGVLDRPVAILARGFGLPRLDSYWRSRRERFGNQLFSRSGGFREVLANLRNRKDVAVLVDQNVKINHAIFVPFFGIPASTSKPIGVAALRSGSPSLVCACIEIAPWKFMMMAEEVPPPSSYDGESDQQIFSYLDCVHRVMERYISEYPEQWFWIHRRFKTRPPGEKEDFYAL